MGQLSLPRYSMFMRTPAYSAGGSVAFGLRRRVVIPDQSDTIYEVPPAASNKLWLVSELFYGTKELWWLIAELNNVQDPLALVPSGSQLRIPTRERLSNEGVFNQ